MVGKEEEMIAINERVPGQLLPIGTAYRYNGGLAEYDGYNTARFVGYAIVSGVLGYYIAKQVSPKAGAVGALSAIFLGIPGIAMTAWIYSKDRK